MKLLCLSLLAIFCGAVCCGQLNYNAGNTQAIAGTYTDLGTSGTAITTNAQGNPLTLTSENSSTQDIGFNFEYNGGSYSTFVLNTSGFIKLGTNIARFIFDDIFSASDSNLIAPFSLFGLRTSGPSGGYRVFTTGSPGSRVCTIQFKNLRDFYTNNQYDSINFQVKLYETSNNIEFVYGNFYASTFSPQALYAYCGIKGTIAQTAVVISKAVSTAWNSPVINNGITFDYKFYNQNDVLPTPGTTFRFTADPLNPQTITGVKVDAIYTLGKIPTPLGTYNSYVTARIINTGTNAITSLPVTLNSTGANAYTNTTFINILPGDSTIAYFAFSPWVEGTNTITVSTPNDDDNTNNIVAYTQLVNSNTFSYADGSSPSFYIGYQGILYTKYNCQGNGTVNQVRVFITDDGNNENKFVSGIVSDAEGHIIGQSSPHQILVTELNSYISLPIINPPTVSGEFLVGILQTDPGFSPLWCQTEPKSSRNGAYYYSGTDGSGLTEYVSDVRFIIEAVVDISNIPPFTNVPTYTIAGWDFSGSLSAATFNATTFDSLLLPTYQLTRGPGASNSSGVHSFRTTGFQNDGISVTNNDYFQVMLSPKPGDTLSISNINAYVQGNTRIPNGPGVSSQFAYSIDGTNFNLVGQPFATNNTIQFISVDVTTIPELQDVISGTSVTIRYYASGGAAIGDWGFISIRPGTGLMINGRLKPGTVTNTIITNPVVPSGADFVLSNCSATASGSIGFQSTGTFLAGNNYQLQLGQITNIGEEGQDSVQFFNVATIGSLAGNANSGNINFTIPAGTGYSDGGYVVRVVSTDPYIEGSLSQPFYIYQNGICNPYSSTADFFRSRASGNWNDLNTWESSNDFFNWIPATVIPDENSGIVNILPEHTVTVTSNVAAGDAVIEGNLILQNNGTNNGTMYFKTGTELAGRSITFAMEVDTTGTLQVNSSAEVYHDVIFLADADGLVSGRIMVGDGSIPLAAGYDGLATENPSQFKWLDGSVFEWNSNSGISPGSDATYFNGTATDAGVPDRTPAFRLTAIPTATLGSSGTTLVNGLLDVNTPVTWTGSGLKVFRDGIEGASIFTQSASAGECRITSSFARIPGTDTSKATLRGVLNGTLDIHLNHSTGLTLPQGIAIPETADINMSGLCHSSDTVQVFSSGIMTVDSDTLFLDNADLVNAGQIIGPGKIQFSGNELSSLTSPGTITAPIILFNKQLFLGGNSNTDTITLMNTSNLRLDSFNLNMGNAGLIADNTNFIITNDTGKLVRNVASTEVNFPIGISGTSYTPLFIKNNGIAGSFKVRVEPGVTMTARSAPSDNIIQQNGNVDRTWHVDSTQAGGILDLRLQWNSIDEQPGFDRMNSFIAQLHECNPPPNCDDGFYYDNAARTAALGTDPYTQSRNNITRPTSFIVKSVSDTSTFVNIAGNGNWNDPLNWRIGIVPSTTIANGKVIVIDYPNPQSSTPCSVIGDIIIEPGGQLIIRNNCILTVTGNIINH